MNENFLKLDKLKQDRIINAALKVFSMHDYKLANTNDIAAGAGISKGLLFHYFGSKKQLYLYLYQYSASFIKDHMKMDELLDDTDFFSLIMNAQQLKTAIMLSYPYIFSYLLKAYYEQDAAVADEIAALTLQFIDNSTALVLQNTDRSKFKDGLSVEQVLNVIIWCAEGFMRTKIHEEPLDVEAINQEFLDCLQLFKQGFYKEEYV